MLVKNQQQSVILEGQGKIQGIKTQSFGNDGSKNNDEIKK
jgi:hypothetical protein